MTDSNARRFMVNEAVDLAGQVPLVVMTGNLLTAHGYAVTVRRVSTPSAGGSEWGELLVRGSRDERGVRRIETLEFRDPTLAGQLLRSCQYKSLLRRYSFADGWMVDVFDWENEGLVLAQFPNGLEAPDDYPAWLGTEVTHEASFDAEWLTIRPWRTWAERERAVWRL